MKIPTESIIEVHGFVMLKKVPSGHYRVSQGNYQGQPIYRFYRPRGRKPLVAHYASSVDPFVRESGDADCNRIEIVREGS